MSDVTVLYNRQAVSAEELVALCQEIRTVIAPINDQAVDAIVVQLQSAEYSAGYGDIDVSIMCSVDGRPEREDAVQPLSKAVADFLETYVREHGLANVKTVSAVARVAAGHCTFREINH